MRRTDERSKILGALFEASDEMSPTEIAVATAIPRNNVDQLLFKMAKAGEVLKLRRGRYVHPERNDLASSAHADKIDKKIRTSQDSAPSANQGRQSYFLSILSR